MDGKDKGKVGTETSWKEYIINIDETDIESIKEGKYMTDQIIRVMMKYIQEWLQMKGEKLTHETSLIIQEENKVKLIKP